MQYKTYMYSDGWDEAFDTTLDSEQTLVFVFGSDNVDLIKKPLEDVKNSFKNSTIIGASTAGEIFMDELHNDKLLVTVVQFSTTTVKLSTKKITATSDSFLIGSQMAQELKSQDLNNIFILSDGLKINGSQLTSGFSSIGNTATLISGGLAGDDGEFESTWVIVDGEAKSGYVTAVGLYGKDIQTSFACNAGWDIFGIQRLVTKSINNVVYELDNQPILDIYKKYLGEQAKNLPASGLLFPLGIFGQEKEKDEIIIRTILAIDEEEKSITFAGDIQQGSIVGLMKSNNNRLIEAASKTSQEINLDEYLDEPILNIAISCIGRKLVLKQRTEEELEAVLENLPKSTLQIGFYSFGEISPNGIENCLLHNQTMTLTTLWEKNAQAT